MANPPKGGDAKLRAYLPSGTRSPGRRKHQKVGVCSPPIAADGGFLFAPRLPRRRDRPCPASRSMPWFNATRALRAQLGSPAWLPCSATCQALTRTQSAGATPPRPLTLTLTLVAPARALRAHYVRAIRRRSCTSRDPVPPMMRRLRVGPRACTPCVLEPHTSRVVATGDASGLDPDLTPPKTRSHTRTRKREALPHQGWREERLAHNCAAVSARFRGSPT